MAVYRTKVALSWKGDRIERGGEITLTDEEAAGLDPADIELADATPAEEAEEEVAEKPLEEMTSAELKARAKELGLSATGSAADIRERITLHLSKPAPQLVDFVVTEEYLAQHPDLEVNGKKVEVGDTIQVSEGEITND